jgi:hypothetical protein
LGFHLLVLAGLLLLSSQEKALLPSQVQQPAEGVSYRQSYAIYIRGDFSGREQVEESVDKDGNLVVASRHELMISDGLEAKRLAFETTTVSSARDRSPIRYSYRYTSGESRDSCSVAVKDGMAVRELIRGSRRSQNSVAVQPDVVLMDFNVYHHYDNLARSYDLKKGGRQTPHNYVPLLGTAIQLAISRLADTNLEYSGGKIPVRNFKVEYSGTHTAVFSTDTSGRVVRIMVRDQDLEVVREDLVSSADGAAKPPNP